MHCLLAIFLYTGLHTLHTDRLVVLQLDGTSDHFKTYQPTKPRQLPPPEAHEGIHIASSPIQHEGTYITIYCSASISVKRLWEFASQDAAELHKNHAVGFQDVHVEDNCLKSLRQGFYQSKSISRSHREMEVQALPYIRNGICTESSIYSLAMQGLISLTALNNVKIASRGDDVRVRYDEELSMASVVLGGQFLNVQRTIYGEVGLAWHQGNLEIFQKELPTKIWMQSDKMRPRCPRRHLIVDLVANHFWVVGAIIRALESQKTHDMVSDEWKQPLSAEQELQHIQLLLAQLRHSGTKFAPVYATDYFAIPKVKHSVSS